ncbi:bifunctional 3'-5' exonuclease/ATP-dependent helicase WRN-like [Argopecten irradians]|uniref:bifunctional 3'-5' exonuclease/ATP-dependent helicase WRN-like n=1 Tax=Argopecten irradians TaxID=31199 RepID=UPI003721CA90
MHKHFLQRETDNDQRDRYTGSLIARDEFLRDFKAKIEEYFVNVSLSKSQHEQDDEGSRTGSNSSRSTSSSKISAKRLKEEQLKIELSARKLTLQKEREIELAKLSFKLEEEELQFNTDLAVANAKSKMFSDFEQTDTSECPLVSLMQDQVKRLATISCVTAAYKGDSSETDDLIREGKIDIIFASPETLVGDRHWRNDLEKLNVCAIVVDEFHTILSWGGLADEEEKSVFRKWFRHIGELRSLFPTAPVLALSATCTKAVKKRVMSVLNFDDKTRFMFISPNKENIKFVVHRTANDAEAAIFWLVEALAKFENAFPKIIVYCNSIKDVSSIYNIIVTELPEAVSYVEMYHSETTDEKKEQILRDIGEGQRLKIVIATSALGMGVDVADCHNIVFYGPPKTIVDLVQQAGRAGRDGEQSTALLLCNPHQLVHIDDDVKEIVRTKTCRRSAIMQCFLSSSEVSKLSNIRRHNCCDLCMTVCACGECNQTAIEQLLTAATLENKEVKEGSCSDSDTISYEYESDLELANMEMPE